MNTLRPFLRLKLELKLECSGKLSGVETELE